MPLDQPIGLRAQWVLTAVLLEIALSCMAVVGVAHSNHPFYSLLVASLKSIRGNWLALAIGLIRCTGPIDPCQDSIYILVGLESAPLPRPELLRNCAASSSDSLCLLRAAEARPCNCSCSASNLPY